MRHVLVEIAQRMDLCITASDLSQFAQESVYICPNWAVSESLNSTSLQL